MFGLFNFFFCLQEEIVAVVAIFKAFADNGLFLPDVGPICIGILFFQSEWAEPWLPHVRSHFQCIVSLQPPWILLPYCMKSLSSVLSLSWVIRTSGKSQPRSELFSSILSEMMCCGEESVFSNDMHFNSFILYIINTHLFKREIH